VIVILGTPGAGKTTQAQLLARDLNCPWFSMGQLIRDKASGQTRRHMLAGKIIDDQTTINLLDTTLQPIDTANQEVVVEGNPRSVVQAQWWLEQIKSGRFKWTGLVHLTANPAIAEERMLRRGRLDDHDEGVISKRFEEYQRSIKPTLDYLKSQGITVHHIDADSSAETVAQKIHQALGV